MAALIRAFANIANELEEAGYSAAEIAVLKTEVRYYESVRQEVKLSSGDYIDLKMYKPAMRHLIDACIGAEESQKVAAFDDISLVQLIVERGAKAVDCLPKGIRENKEAVAEAIENNFRKVITDEHPINPKYNDRMSELLDALIEERRKQALNYRQYLEKIVALTKKVQNPTAGESYPKTLNTGGKRALYDNLGRDESLALAVDAAVRESRMDDWCGNPFKIKKMMFAIKGALHGDDALTARILETSEESA